MAETATKSWTVEEMLREGLDPKRYEIVHGDLVELEGNGMRGGWVAAKLGFILVGYLEANPLGVPVSNQRFRLRRSPLLERVPDLAVVLAPRVPVPLPEGTVDGPPDIAIEVVSPTDEAGDVADKAEEYLAHGTREVWLVQPRLCTVNVLRLGEAPLAVDQRVALETALLPGFSLPLARLFAPPPAAAAGTGRPSPG